MRARIILLFALCTAICIGGCQQSDSTTGGTDRPNVLLIVLDTTRADKLGCYGSNLGATPNIDQLAEQSVRFERCYAHAPWTLPSFASLFTSLNVPEHGAGGQLGQFRRLSDERRTLAEVLGDAGYATAAIVNVDFLSTTFGVTQGFEHLDHKAFPNNVDVRRADETTDAALSWLAERPHKPFFLFVHYFDPHLVYDPPDEFRQRFAGRLDRNNRAWTFGTRSQITAFRRGQTTFSREIIKRAEKLYDGEIAFTDQQVGRLLEGLQATGLDESTLVVLTADHGEEFADHGGFEHGHTLFDELVRVPLILRMPGTLAPGVVDTRVAHVDVAPTICALTNVPPAPAFVGRDLQSVITDPDAIEIPIVLEGNFWGPPFYGWIYDGHKFVIGPQGKLLFNLDADPAELNELSAAQPKRLEEMMEDLRLARRAMDARNTSAAGEPVELDPDEIERLRSLGYLE